MSDITLTATRRSRMVDGNLSSPLAANYITECRATLVFNRALQASVVIPQEILEQMRRCEDDGFEERYITDRIAEEFGRYVTSVVREEFKHIATANRPHDPSDMKHVFKERK